MALITKIKILSQKRRTSSMESIYLIENTSSQAHRWTLPLVKDLGVISCDHSYFWNRRLNKRGRKTHLDVFAATKSLHGSITINQVNIVRDGQVHGLLLAPKQTQDFRFHVLQNQLCIEQWCRWKSRNLRNIQTETAFLQRHAFMWAKQSLTIRWYALFRYHFSIRQSHGKKWTTPFKRCLRMPGPRHTSATVLLKQWLVHEPRHRVHLGVRWSEGPSRHGAAHWRQSR